MCAKPLIKIFKKKKVTSYSNLSLFDHYNCYNQASVLFYMQSTMLCILMCEMHCPNTEWFAYGIIPQVFGDPNETEDKPEQKYT